MSQVVAIKNSNIKDILNHLNFFIPSGETSMPIQVSVENGKLVIACQGFMQYKAFLGTVESEDVSITVVYHDISPFIQNGTDIEFEFFDNSLSIVTTSFSCTFQASYDFLDVTIDSVDPVKCRLIEDKSVYANLNSFLYSTGLFRLYKKESPYIIYENIIVLKTETMWLQGRIPGFSINAIMNSKVVNTLNKLMPTMYFVNNTSLYIFGDNYTCVLPITPILEPNSFKEVLSTLGNPVNFNTENTSDIVNTICKLNPQFITVSMMQNGLSVSAYSGNFQIYKVVGMVGEPIKTFRVSPSLLQMAFRMLPKNSMIQVIYGENLICFRNQTLIIVVRAL